MNLLTDENIQPTDFSPLLKNLYSGTVFWHNFEHWRIKLKRQLFAITHIKVEAFALTKFHFHSCLEVPEEMETHNTKYFKNMCWTKSKDHLQISFPFS